MSMAIDRLRILAVLAPLVALVACGNHGSPTAPSGAPTVATVAAPTTAIAGATIVGKVSGGSTTSALRVRTFGMAGVTVTVVGTGASTTVDAEGSFTVINVPPIEVVLNFSGPGVNASVPIGLLANDDHVQIGVTLSSTTATLDSLTSTTTNSTAVSMRGAITSLIGNCPSLTLVVGGTTVQTNGATTFSEKSCVEIVTGDAAGVVGTKGSNGIVLATAVNAAKPATVPPAPLPPTPPPATPATVTMNGTIGSIGGTCPTLSMTVSGTYVRTDNATLFTGRSCADFKSGDTVGLAGARQSDGSVLASTLVASGSPPTSPTPVTVSGTLGTFNGPCPTLSMLVGGSYVRTNSSTTFTGKSCGDLKSGDVLSIVASNTGDNLGLLASKVTVTGSAPVPPPVPVTMSGTISALGGLCPRLDLMVAGTYVVTDASTTFSGKGCNDLKVGDTLDVVGTHPADSGTVTATKVTTTASPPPPPPSLTVTMNGTIGGVTGTCPALAMSDGSTYVRTSSATTFSGKACGELKVGDAIGVAGVRQTDGTVLASLVAAGK